MSNDYVSGVSSACDSSEFMRTLFESAPDSIVIIDDAGLISRLNARLETVFQYDRENLIGKPMETLFPERFRVAQRENFIRVLTTQHSSAGIILGGLKKNGTEFPIDLMLSSLKASSGNMVIAVMRDITERQESANSLRRTEEALSLLVEGVQDYAIFMLDLSGKILSWNAGAQNIKGYEAGEIIGSHFSRFYTDEDIVAEKPNKELEQALRLGKCQDEGLRKRKDGSTFWADVTITRVQNEAGEIIGFSKVTRDTSDRKNAVDAMLQLSQQREDFVATLTHDLKTPVFAANRAIKFIIDGEFGPVTKEHVEVLQTIYESNESMYRMITSLLDVYRYEDGSRELQLGECDIAALITKTVHELSPIALSRKVDLTVKLPIKSKPIVCDEGQIRRVLQNLIDNGLKFTKQGGSVEVEMLHKIDNSVEVSVTDTGKGISDTNLPKLFQRFWTPKESGRTYASTGLGLYLSRQIVESHGGDIRCESRYGQGSKFTFSLASN